MSRHACSVLHLLIPPARDRPHHDPSWSGPWPVLPARRTICVQNRERECVFHACVFMHGAAGSTLARNADSVAHLRRHGQAFVGLGDPGDAGGHFVREVRGLVAGQIHMADDHFQHASHPAVAGVAHLLHVVHALVVMIEELHINLHAVAGGQFAQV